MNHCSIKIRIIVFRQSFEDDRISTFDKKFDSAFRSSNQGRHSLTRRIEFTDVENLVFLFTTVMGERHGFGSTSLICGIYNYRFIYVSRKYRERIAECLSSFNESTLIRRGSLVDNFPRLILLHFRYDSMADGQKSEKFVNDGGRLVPVI